MHTPRLDFHRDTSNTYECVLVHKAKVHVQKYMQTETMYHFIQKKNPRACYGHCW